MPLEPPVDDEEYASSEDSDFAPDDAQERASSAGSDDEAGDATDAQAPGKRKRGAGDAEAEDAGFENSGDEAIIEKAKKRRKRGKHAEGGNADEEGGDGGLIKTRSQRAQEKAERKAAVATGPVTIDVDAVWAQMLAGNAAKTSPDQSSQDAHGQAAGAKAGQAPGADAESGAAKTAAAEPSEMVKIKRTYNFAGKVHTEEKLVPRDSAEAKLYLESQGENGTPDESEDPTRRLPRRAFRSVFEPVIDSQLLQRSDLNLGMMMRLQAREQAKDAKKLNVVEKSRMDWAGYVDKEGIKDELALAGKSKGAYSERQQFLARSEAIREEEARRARLAGKA